MRIFAHMVTRNEAGRYLRECLEWHLPHVDGFHVYDDCSDDGTLELAMELGAGVDRRPSSAPSFADNEARFRNAAWASMEELLQPEPGDWILCVDADEFVMSTRPDQDLGQVLRGTAREAMKWARRGESCNAVRFNVEEIWGDDGARTYVRTDGFWGGITAERFIAWQPDGTFTARRGMGGGSLPSYKVLYPKTCTAATIAHVGYLDAQDRIRKYDRYLATHGHSTRHVRSIIDMPELSPLRPECLESPWRRRGAAA